MARTNASHRTSGLRGTAQFDRRGAARHVVASSSAPPSRVSPVRRGVRKHPSPTGLSMARGPDEVGNRPHDDHAGRALTAVRVTSVAASTLLDMERAGARSSLHHRLLRALARSEQAQAESRALIATTQEIHVRLQSTRAAAHRARERRAEGTTFAFGQVDDQDRLSSG
jgi:hypothetical protein